MDRLKDADKIGRLDAQRVKRRDQITHRSVAQLHQALATFFAGSTLSGNFDRQISMGNSDSCNHYASPHNHGTGALVDDHDRLLIGLDLHRFEFGDKFHQMILEGWWYHNLDAGDVGRIGKEPLKILVNLLGDARGRGEISVLQAKR